MLNISLAIVGGRDFTDYALLKKTVDKIREEYEITRIVSGGARGADSLAERYAQENDIPILVLKPDWSKGRGAGLARNKDIVEQSDFVLAFWDGESKGTKNTISRTKRHGEGKKLRVHFY